MGNRLRGMVSAYKVGRLDEYIILRFGSYKDYEEYVLRHSWYSYHRGIPTVKTGRKGGR